MRSTTTADSTGDSWNIFVLPRRPAWEQEQRQLRGSASKRLLANLLVANDLRAQPGQNQKREPGTGFRYTPRAESTPSKKKKRPTHCAALPRFNNRVVPTVAAVPPLQPKQC